MKKLIAVLLLACPLAWARNAMYQMDTDTITVHGAIVWPNGTVQVSSPSAGGGSTNPAGVDKNIQFNNSNAFGADPQVNLFTGATPFISVGDDNNGPEAIVQADGTVSVYDAGDTHFTNMTPTYVSVAGNNMRISADLSANEMDVTSAGVLYLAGENDTITLWPTSMGKYTSIAPQVTLGTDDQTDASAIVQMVSTTQGFLPPKMTTVQRDAISSPSEELLVGNVTSHTLDYYDGTLWKPLAAVAGLNFQVQFSSNGSLGASPDLTWDPNTSALIVTGSATVTNGLYADDVHDAGAGSLLLHVGAPTIIEMDPDRIFFNEPANLVGVSTHSAISPSPGDIIFTSDTLHFMGYNGTTWKQLD